jgi:DNA-binding protein Alba
MMTSVVQQATTSTSTTPTTTSPSSAATMTASSTPATTIPSHFLIVGKKNALDYIAPALFRIGTFGELVVRAKGSMSIVTAVNVAEMVKKDIAGLQTRSVSIGTEEISIDGIQKRVSYIEIHLSKQAPKVETILEQGAQQKLAETASTAKKIRAKAKKTTSAKKKTTSTPRRQKVEA